MLAGGNLSGQESNRRQLAGAPLGFGKHKKGPLRFSGHSGTMAEIGDQPFCRVRRLARTTCPEQTSPAVRPITGIAELRFSVMATQAAAANRDPAPVARQFAIPQSCIVLRSVFTAYKALERVRVTRATFRSGLVDRAAIACNPAHRANMRLLDVSR